MALINTDSVMLITDLNYDHTWKLFYFRVVLWYAVGAHDFEEISMIPTCKINQDVESVNEQIREKMMKAKYR